MITPRRPPCIYNLQLEILFVQIIAVSFILVNWRIFILENLENLCKNLNMNKLCKMLSSPHQTHGLYLLFWSCYLDRAIRQKIND